MSTFVPTNYLNGKVAPSAAEAEQGVRLSRRTGDFPIK